MASNDDPFSGKSSVQVISIIDILLAAMLLCFYGVKWYTYDVKLEEPIPKGPISIESVIRHPSVFVWIAVIIFHSMQLVMAFVLLSSVYDKDAEDALGKCQLWWCTAVMLFMVLALELAVMIYLMIFLTGMQPISMCIFILKLIYRMVAVVTVRRFMKNLKKAPPSSVHQKVYIRSKTHGPPPSNYIRY